MHKRRSVMLEVISGELSGVSVEMVKINLVNPPADRRMTAAAGVIAAAMGLSGLAAGMAMNSSDSMNEYVKKVTFKLDGLRCSAILADWPFEEGGEVKLVCTKAGDGTLVALAVLDESRRIVSLYPHVSAGRFAHRLQVLRYSLWVGTPIAFLTIAAACLGIYAAGESFEGLLLPLVSFFVFFVGIVIFVGYVIGRRFNGLVLMAEEIFIALGWPRVKWINLRKNAASRRRVGDPSALGETYFRY